MNIRRFQQVKEDAGFVASYTHMGGKIGVLVDVATDVVNADIEEMAKNVCMQVAALNPKYTDRSEVDPVSYTHLYARNGAVRAVVDVNFSGKILL